MEHLHALLCQNISDLFVPYSNKNNDHKSVGSGRIFSNVQNQNALWLLVFNCMFLVPLFINFTINQMGFSDFERMEKCLLSGLMALLANIL